MRVTVLILSLVTCFFLFLQAAVVEGLSDNGTADDTAAAFGVLMALMMLASAALVLPVPRVSMIMLALAGAIGFIAAGTSDFTDLFIWGGWCFVLAVLSYFGFRGKRKQQAKDAARDKVAQDALAANQQMAAQMAYMQQQMAAQTGGAPAFPNPPMEVDPVPPAAPLATQGGTCPNCGASVRPTEFFCPSCGKQLRS